MIRQKLSVPWFLGGSDVSEEPKSVSVFTILQSLVNFSFRLVKRDHFENPLDRLSFQQAQNLRYIAISASVILIFSGCVGFYMLGAIDSRKRVFRHDLIFFLLGYDFLKAVTLLFYPARVALVHNAYYNSNFCDIVGFFTAMAIEGADIAIFTFAIHTALLVFNPNKKFKSNNASNHTYKYEGGLFPYRYYIWIISFLFPVILASLAFVNQVGYQPLACWCYLPERPKWYRLVLSWVPRYIIVVTIICVYFSIYFHIIRQFNNILYIHEDINNKQSHRLKLDRNFLKNLKYVIIKNFKGIENLKLEMNATSVTRKLTFRRNKNSVNDYSYNKDEDFDDDDDEEEFIQELRSSKNKVINNDDSENSPTLNQIKLENLKKAKILTKNLHEESMENFTQRKLQIEKQVKSIFIYPISYIFLWLAPFALQCIQYNYELAHGPVYWLIGISAFMQPFNCTVDTLVFLYREKPWKHTVMKNHEKLLKKSRGNDTRNSFDDEEELLNYYEKHETWRQYFSWMPLYALPEKRNEVLKNRSEDELEMKNREIINNILNNNTHDFSDLLK